VYIWIWRRLPGGTAAKVTGALVLVLVASALLLFVVFPHVVPLLPIDDVTTGR
jgi:hypothetical protein